VSPSHGRLHPRGARSRGQIVDWHRPNAADGRRDRRSWRTASDVHAGGGLGVGSCLGHWIRAHRHRRRLVRRRRAHRNRIRRGGHFRCGLGSRSRRRRRRRGRGRRRRGGRLGIRSRCRVRLGRRGSLVRRLAGSRREEEERIAVTVRIAGRADAEMHVRDILFGRARRTDGADRLPFGHVAAARYRDRTEVDDSDRESVGRLDRHTQAVRGHRSREGDHPCPWRGDRGTGVSADVDAAMLARDIGVVPVAERRQYRPGCRPGPGTHRWSENKEDEEGGAGRSQP